MVKPIMRDPLFLAQKSEPATEADKQVVQDLLDTLKANQDRCVGMVANMIGVRKNIIVVAAGPFMFAMINAKLTKKKGAFKTEESCLSLDGVRPCIRYKEIEVDYLDQDFTLISLSHQGDIVVTQDYGVAVMALGKKAYAIHQSGKWYTDIWN